MRALLSSESHGVHGEQPITSGVKIIAADPRAAPCAILAAITEQHDRSDGQVRRFGSEPLQILANARGRLYRRNLLRPVRRRQFTSEPVEPRLKALPQARE